jgi:hypothetical protein
MKKFVFSLVLLAWACGPSYGGQGVKTPEELVAEQEALAAEDEKRGNSDYDTGPDTETDLEKKKQFDKKQAELELKRAARSGETCAGVVNEDGPSGKASVTLVFTNDGHVKESSIGAPFTDTAIGKCVLNAMKAVIVPSFVGADETIEWEVDVKAKEEEKKDDKKKK